MGNFCVDPELALRLWVQMLFRAFSYMKICQLKPPPLARWFPAPIHVVVASTACIPTLRREISRAYLPLCSHRHPVCSTRPGGESGHCAGKKRGHCAQLEMTRSAPVQLKLASVFSMNKPCISPAPLGNSHSYQG